MSREILIRELQFLRANLEHYLTLWPEGKEGWRPTPESYTLLELGAHLCAQPATTAAILRGAPEADVVRITGGPWSDNGPADLKVSLANGFAALADEVEKLTSADFESRPVAWPFGDPLTPQVHLLNLIAHLYHHRGQLHLYYKQLGVPVDTGTIFSA